MMRLLKWLGLMTLLFVLTACQHQAIKADWLKGTWRCREWGVNYTFIEGDDRNWTVKTDEETFTTQAKLEQRKDKYVLVDEKGTEYHIVKKKKDRLIFQQVTTEGLEGTTIAVTFERE